MIWIALTVHNRIGYTRKCLRSLRAQSFQDFTVILCDDGSTDNTSAILASEFPEVIVLKGNGDLWWTGGTNRCVEYILRHCKEKDVVLTLNNDLQMEKNHLRNMHRWAEKLIPAILTSVTYDINDRENPDYVGTRKSWITTKERRLKPKVDVGYSGVAEITHAPGYGTLIPVEVFRQIGLFDYKHFPHYGGDYELTYRARRNGYKVYINYDAKLFLHRETTGFSVIRKKGNFREFLSYLSNQKSPAKFIHRWKLAVKYCPPLLLPSYLIIDNILVVGSYLKFWVSNAMQRM